MNKGLKVQVIGVVVLFVFLLAACEGEPDDTAVSPTSEPTPTATPEAAVLAPATTEPTFMSISQFPVAIIESASAQRPAFAAVEMAGFNVSTLAWQVGQYEADCNRLFSMGLIPPNQPEAETGFWEDGVHRANFAWAASGHYLGDGEQGDFVLVERTPNSSYIGGRYRSAVTGEVVGANLMVDFATTEIVGLQTLNGVDLTPGAGDTFQIFSQCLQADGSVQTAAGPELVLFEGGGLVFEKRPTPSGDYFLHLTVSGPQNSVSSTTDFPVENEALVPGYAVYLDKARGFQFLYPEGWDAPVAENNRIVTGDGDATSLTISLHPDLAGQTPSDLKNQALAQFGNVPVLFEDQVTVGDTGALWTAYGYSGQDGSHTGILLSFVRDGVGYLVDMDGLETAESSTISLTNQLAESWLFRPDIIAPRAMEWTPASFDGLSMPVKATYYQEMLDTGWRRFTVGDGASFMAVRTQSLGRDDISDVLEYWQEVVQRGVTNLAISEEYALTLNQREWSRIDFAYTNDDGISLHGFLISTEIDENAVTFWVEIPAERFEEQSSEFLLSLAGLQQ